MKAHIVTSAISLALIASCGKTSEKFSDRNNDSSTDLAEKNGERSFDIASGNGPAAAKFKAGFFAAEGKYFYQNSKGERCHIATLDEYRYIAQSSVAPENIAIKVGDVPVCQVELQAGTFFKMGSMVMRAKSASDYCHVATPEDYKQMTGRDLPADLPELGNLAKVLSASELRSCVGVSGLVKVIKASQAGKIIEFLYINGEGASCKIFDHNEAEIRFGKRAVNDALVMAFENLPASSKGENACQFKPSSDFVFKFGGGVYRVRLNGSYCLYASWAEFKDSPHFKAEDKLPELYRLPDLTDGKICGSSI